MFKYTKIGSFNAKSIFRPQSLNEMASPSLVFQKWQAYDRFKKENVLEAFDTKKSRLDYLKDLAGLVDIVSQETYQEWYEKYEANMTAIHAKKLYDYRTLWRLIVGWSTNPTLEVGLTLQHLYGFPIIPGSMVKGFLHSYVEILLQDNAMKINSLEKPDEANISDKEKILQLLIEVQLAKEIFGSIHLERGKKQNNYFGPSTLKGTLSDFSQKNKEKPEWNNEINTIRKLLSEQTGGMVDFFDAVPAPGQDDILQTDILNPHYPDYYGDGQDSIVPSDDQNPRPIYFLAVAPNVSFDFFYKIKWPSSHHSDVEAVWRKSVLEANDLDLTLLESKIEKLFENALQSYGLGAKTASGYGYFESYVSSPGAAKINAATKNMKSSNDDLNPDIIAVEPKAMKVSTKKQKKIEGIKKQYHPNIWENIAKSPFVFQIEGVDFNAFPDGPNAPILNIEKDGKLLRILYRVGIFNCTVIVKLQGINNKEEAKYIWERTIKPELSN